MIISSFKRLQWLVLLLIRIREKLDFHKFIKKPITKEVDDMDNCHFRTLYKQHTFDDNFTDPDFLSSMQLNTNLNYYTLGEAMLAATHVALYTCPCILYFIMYYHLSHQNVSPELVFGIALLCTVSGYGLFQWSQWTKDVSCTEELASLGRFQCLQNIITKLFPVIWNDLMVTLCCGGISYLLVPILRTVTQTVDTPTVYAVCTIMFGVHLLCNDYGLKVALVSTPLSMNSAIFSVICLASRLQTDEHCLALIAFGVMSFICFPQWNRSIQNCFKKWSSLAALTLMNIVTYAGVTVSWRVATLIVALILMIVAASPMLYVCYVQHKVNILGPWDEARPELHVDMEEIERGFELRRSKRENSSEESVAEVKGESNNKIQLMGEPENQIA